MKFNKLNNGVEIPILGYGVFQIPDKELCEKCVSDALDVGYRLIDTAAAYMNEDAVGAAIKKSGIDRPDLFITTKLWIQDTGYTKTQKAVEKSLKNLGLDYLDLYLIHQPYGDVHGSWRAMEELYKTGVIRAIGISNFAPDQVLSLSMFNEIPPAINQIETHPFCQQIESQKFHEENNIQVQSWGPFAEGKNDIFNNPLLLSIGEKYNKSIAQVILRWMIQRNIVVIPKTTSRDRMIENYNVFDFELSNEDMINIGTLDTKQSLFLDHRNPETVKWLCGRQLPNQ